MGNNVVTRSEEPTAAGIEEADVEQPIGNIVFSVFFNSGSTNLVGAQTAALGQLGAHRAVTGGAAQVIRISGGSNLNFDIKPKLVVQALNEGNQRAVAVQAAISAPTAAIFPPAAYVTSASDRIEGGASPDEIGAEIRADKRFITDNIATVSVRVGPEQISKRQFAQLIKIAENIEQINAPG